MNIRCLMHIGFALLSKCQNSSFKEVNSKTFFKKIFQKHLDKRWPKIKPSQAEPSWVELSRADSSGVEPIRAELSRIEPSRVQQSRVEQSPAESCLVESSRVYSSRINLIQAKLNQAKCFSVMCLWKQSKNLGRTALTEVRVSRNHFIAILHTYIALMNIDVSLPTISDNAYIGWYQLQKKVLTSNGS